MVRVKRQLQTVYHVGGRGYTNAEKAYEYAAALSVFKKYDAIKPRSEIDPCLVTRLARYMQYVDDYNSDV